MADLGKPRQPASRGIGAPADDVLAQTLPLDTQLGSEVYWPLPGVRHEPVDDRRDDLGVTSHNEFAGTSLLKTLASR